MRRSAAVTILVFALAACFGASLVQRATRGQAEAGGGRQPERSQTPIDQNDVRELQAVRAPDDFGARAMEHLRTVVGFGARHAGGGKLDRPTPGWSKQLDYITAQLQALGLEVERDTWTDRRERITFTNLSTLIPGDRPERILLACHHDTKCTQGHDDPAHNFPFVGANDGGSGVAFLLALAPVLQQRTNRATFQLAFFDGEESLDWSWNNAARALFGSRRFARRSRLAERDAGAPPIVAMVLLDMVARTDLHIQEELYSTPALRRLVWSAAVATRHRDHFFRRHEAASDDHIPFLDFGIPAVDLIDLNGNPYWHTPEDTLENVSAASLQVVGDVVLTMLPALEQDYVTDAGAKDRASDGASDGNGRPR
ncbi:MAG: M28 family peptidase [Planctomycetota bacterium]